MTPHEYQQETRRTRQKESRERALMHFAIGLCGECGEVADLLKKHLYYGHDVNRDKLIEEAGDALWYVTSLVDKLGIPVEGLLTSGPFAIGMMGSKHPRQEQLEDDIEGIESLSSHLLTTSRAIARGWVYRDDAELDGYAARFLGHLVSLLSLFDITLEEVMTANIEKRRLRFPNGFTPADAAERKDEANG